VLVGRPALGEDLELGLVVGHVRTLPCAAAAHA
jgi:hypothetical protein